MLTLDNYSLCWFIYMGKMKLDPLLFHGKKEETTKPKTLIHGFYISRDNLQDGFYTFFVV